MDRHDRSRRARRAAFTTCAALALAAPIARAAPAEPDTAAPPPAVVPAPPAPQDAPRARAAFVVSGTFGLNVGLSAAPSLEPSLFLGGALPVASRFPAGWVALGYQGSASVGRADFTPLRVKNGLDHDDPFLGIFVHRHHLAVQGATGREGRLAYGAGFGVVHAGDRGLGLEADGRLGYVFSRDSRVQGSVGGLLRVTGVFGEPPQPQLGIFVAVTRAPFAPLGPPPGAPRRGVVLMTVGGLLIAGAILDGVAWSLETTTACRAGSCEGGLGAVIIGAPVLSILGVAGITCLAVGGKRNARYRAWRARVEPRGAGLAF